ncbi:LamG-like jellyroll fold domain-containing protein [Ferruginibacter sp. SUN106]|uniref:LamG-like jellyroll fold domain-containing protein n=1 Tax=Ferruginibacter sp. SUN106 TaxID=2978348 RepID=UPI003D36E010
MKNLYALLVICLLFTASAVAQPTITSFTPASGPVGSLVTVTGTNMSTPTAFSIGGKPAIVLSNTGTVLVGLVMPGTATGTVSITTAAGTGNSSSNFTPVTGSVPSIQQGSKLVGTGATGAAKQGGSVAISADGNTALVGGLNDNSGIGAVWVYTRSGTTWSQQGTKLVGTGTSGTSVNMGAVALSANGNTAVVGGYNDNGFDGATWVFTRSGSTWTQQGTKLVGTGGGGSYQGCAVAVSADGNTLVTGASRDNGTAGAIWVFTRSGSTWSQQGSKLTGTGANGTTSNQGFAVALSADGNTAIEGAPGDFGTAGAAWVFTRSGNTWSQQGSKLTGTGSVGTAQQGYAVSIAADGNTAMIGGIADNGSIGSAWVFTRSGSTWTQQGSKLTGTGSSGIAVQGASVSLSADGNTAVVGGYLDNSGTGAAWVWSRSGSTWAQQGSKLVGTGGTGTSHQGMSVALSADGSTAVTGGDFDATNTGAAWVFTVPPASYLNFDGSDDVVNLGTTINTAIDPLNKITVEAWVRPETNTGYGMIVGNYNSPGAGLQFLLRRDGTGYSFWVDDGTGFKSVVAAGTVVINTWQHLAGVWNGADIKIYVDGVLKATTTGVTGSSFATSTNNVLIGGNNTGEIFKGSIDEVRIWNSDQTAGDIIRRKNCELAGTETGLIRYYKFNQGIDGGANAATTTLTDATVSANNGTLTNFALSGTASNWLATPASPVTSGISVPSAPVAAAQDVCPGTTVAGLVPAPGATVSWYNVATGGSALAGSTIVTAGTYYVTSVNANGCESSRTPVAITIKALPAFAVSNQTLCANTATALITFTPVSGTVCGNATENSNVILTAPAGNTFTSVVFASYGLPNGTCGNFTIGTCHQVNSATIVAGLITGQNSVSIPANNATFTDPCVGPTKRLYIEAGYAPATVFNWTNNNTSIGLAASGTGNTIPSFTATNSTASPIVATITVTATANGCTSVAQTFTITVNPLPAMATVATTQTLNVSAATYFSNNCVSLIAGVTPNGASPVSGSTTAKVWIETSQAPNYVKRHYEITPASGAATATANVTLFFTQGEFDAFNAVNTTKLPGGPGDATGIANLLIEKRSGVSSDGSGLPNTYTGSIITINPPDANIVWNATFNRWEVTFPVTGFSGFFIKTNFGTLAVTLIDFSATKINTGVLLQWQTSNEQNADRFEVESSIDGINFYKTGTVTAKNLSGVNNYQFTDASAWTNYLRYYRLKSIDTDGKYKYSGIAMVSNKQNTVATIYPNPATDVFTLSIQDTKLLHTPAVLVDVNGKTISVINITELRQKVAVSGIPTGVYILRLQNGVNIKFIKE